MPLGDELYKALIDESKLYREKVSTIWLQKFTMLGGIILFAALRAEAASKDPYLIAAAILALPLVALLLDIKLGEFGMHARIIDDFIIRNYPEPHVLGDWERTKWGDIDSPDRALVRYRSIATVAVTVIPTCIIAILSVLAARRYLCDSPARQPFLCCSFYGYLFFGAIAFCVLYIASAWISGPTVLFRRIVPVTKEIKHKNTPPL